MASRRGKKANQSSPKSPVRGTWSPEEDQALANAVEENGAKNWKKIAEMVPGRSDVQCLHRWQKVLNPALIKGPWTDEEDEKVKELVATYGPKKWSLIASFLPGRIGKQCRERWANHLDPSVKKGDWQPWEDEMIIKLQRVHGNKWAKMTKDLPGRTDNAIKNRFNSTISRRLKQEKGPSTPKTRRVAQKITPSKRAPSSPLAHESTSCPGITKRYPSRTTAKLRQSVLNKSLSFDQEVASSPPPSSPMSLSSLQSYTSEEDLDDNFIGYSEEEQSDHTISSDADFEDPSEVKPEAANLSVLKPDFSELVELCANDLGAGGTSSSAPKIVLCQETPEGTRFFDPREVVGAAALVGALSAVSDSSPSPCKSPARDFSFDYSDSSNQHGSIAYPDDTRSPFSHSHYSPSPSPSPRSPTPRSPVASPSKPGLAVCASPSLLLSPTFGRPRRSTCNYNRYNRNSENSATNGNGSNVENCTNGVSRDGARGQQRMSEKKSKSPSPSPALKSAFSPVSSPATLEPRPTFSPSVSPMSRQPLRQFLPTPTQNKRAKRRLNLAEEEEGIPTLPPAKRLHTESIAANSENSENSGVNTNPMASHTLFLPPLHSYSALPSSPCRASSPRPQPSPKKEGLHHPLISFIEDIHASAIHHAVSHLTPVKASDPLPSPASPAHLGTPHKTMDLISSVLAPATLIRYEGNTPVTSSSSPSPSFQEEQMEEESNSLGHSDGGYVASLALCQLLHTAHNSHPLEV